MRLNENIISQIIMNFGVVTIFLSVLQEEIYGDIFH